MKISDIANAMDPPHYTARQVAERVGISEDTVVRWRKAEVALPTVVRAFGSVSVPLYTDETVEEMKEIKGTFKPGPKKKVAAHN